MCQVPPNGRDSQFACGGYHRDVAVSHVSQAPEERAQRAWVSVGVLSRLDEHPTGVRVTLLGDGAVVAVWVTVTGAGAEAQVTGRLGCGVESLDRAPSG